MLCAFDTVFCLGAASLMHTNMLALTVDYLNVKMGSPNRSQTSSMSALTVECLNVVF